MNTSQARTPTILIVEDVDWIRSGMRKSVEWRGMRVVEATNDAEAIEVAQRESPELILTEEELPTLQPLLARLHEHPALRNVPVVIVSPDAEDGARLNGALLLSDYDRLASLLISPRE